MSKDTREIACHKAVSALEGDDLRDAFEYATNTSATGVKRSALIKRVVQGVLDCEVSVDGFDAYAKEPGHG